MMTTFMMTGLLLLSCTSAAAVSVSPVQKVIELLEDNKVKITNDLAATEKEMTEYTDFCEKETSEKGYAIKTSQSRIEDLSAIVAKCEGQIPMYQDEIATQGREAASKQQQLSEAAALREKERADFQASEKELVTAIDQLARAVSIIKREMSTVSSFAQVPEGTESAGVKKVQLALKALNKIINSGRIGVAAQRNLEGLLQTKSAEFDFQPQAKQVAYESKSGGIVEKIEEMKEKAEETLSGSRAEETKASNEFSMLEQSLANGIKVAEEKGHSAKSASGASTEQMNQAKGDSTETAAAKAADEDYLQTLKHDCEEAAANWAERQESARAEMGAINKAIEVLSEGVRVLLQTGSSHRSSLALKNNLEQWDREISDDSSSTDVPAPSSDSIVRSKMVEHLKGLSRQFGSYALMQLAGSAAMDPFAKVRGLIEDMIAKLLQEAQEEATQKAFCDKEMGENTKSKEAKMMTLDKLNSRIDQASARTAELGGIVKTLQSEVAELDAATAEATKMRAEEHENYLKASKDFGDAVAATEKAIKILTDFYDNASLLQTGARRSTLKAGASQPEMGGSKSEAGGVIISILEMSNEDFAKLHSECETTEAEAQEAFDKLTNDNKASRAAKEAEVKGSESEIKSLKVALAEQGEDKTATGKELDAVLDFLDKLKPQCEEKVMSYAEKKARREAEIEGLKEALEILEGSALLQIRTTHHRLRRHVA